MNTTTSTMKRLAPAVGLFIVCGACLHAFALPTYEPFTEFAPTLASNPTNLFVMTNGVSIGTGANSSIPNCLDLATGGYTAPGGEQWGNLNFSGTGSVPLNGLDVAVVSNASLFTYSALSSLLPATFPGMPGPGQAITNFAENPAQPLLWNGTSYVNSNYVGNSAVLKFAQPITRPAAGTKTVFVSYLLSIAQQGQLGAGNDGRYLAFLSQSNLVEGAGSGGAYTTWSSLFNVFSASSGVHYVSHGVLQKTANSVFYIGPCDSTGGKTFSSSVFTNGFNAPMFVVGAYVLNGSGSDTNAMWVNPSLGSFGGPTPPLSPVQANTPAFSMSDLGGLVLIDRVGSGASGGVGTNYIANLLVGTTWSYVTGGPEFTTPPTNAAIFGYGATVVLTGTAVAAAQNVTYQWQRVVGGVTNILTDGVGTAGGGATVSGSGTSTLTLTGVTAGDVAGSYLLVATAGGTGYTLAAPASIIYHTDPYISSNPADATANYGGMAAFIATATTAKPTLSYQWYHGATPLVDGAQGDGSTVTGSSGTGSGPSLTTTLLVSNVSYLDAGSYSVVVTNNVDNAVSSSAGVLTVNDPIIVTQPPNTVLVPVGGTNALPVVAAGSGLTYQWYNSGGALTNGGDFFGVTTATLQLTNAQPGDADSYYVIVHGASGSSVQSSSTVVYVDNTALQGPFSQTDWPPSIATNANGKVDYAVFDPSVTWSVPAGWNNIMRLTASGGDQTWTTVTLGGGTGDEATGTYFNFVDPNWTNYGTVPVIDILLSVYGNADMYDANGNGLPTTYTEGTLATGPYYAHAGTFPLGADNAQWNWMLLSVPNPIDGNGLRYVGDPAGATGSGVYGGVNNGTLRLEGFTAGMTIRAVAFGPHGVFGTSNQVNRFEAPLACAPEPPVNLAYIDFNQPVTNNLSVMNDPNLGETIQVQSGVGPAGDLRTAIQSTSGIMEFPILNNYLGLPCNDNHTMQVCIEFYDDPALAGSQFGPYQYATDYQGDLQTYLGNYYTLTGSGQWLKVAFYVGPANLQGVNTAPLTGGPTLLFSGGIPYIDRVELGILRTGTNALAGQIPDPNYNMDPFVCSTNYGYYVEWNPQGGVTNNLDVAAGYSTAVVGPPNDQRVAEQGQSLGVSGVYFLQFALLNSPFGPVLQDNADVVMTLTYYDDPALAGAELLPNVYNSWVNGSQSVISPSAPYNTPVTLQGSGQWRDAQFELPNVDFYGSYVCKFNTYYASGPVYVSRARFDIIRPCGPFLGIDYLQSLGMTNGSPNLNLGWRGTATLVGSPNVSGPYTSLSSTSNTVNNVYPAPKTNSAQFFRLAFPGYPSYLSPYGP